jgi:hypothetical protein
MLRIFTASALEKAVSNSVSSRMLRRAGLNLDGLPPRSCTPLLSLMSISSTNSISRELQVRLSSLSGSVHRSSYFTIRIELVGISFDKASI